MINFGNIARSILLIGIMSGCGRGVQTYSIEVCSRTRFYINGRLHATELIPALPYKGFERDVIVVDVNCPEILTLDDFLNVIQESAPCRQCELSVFKQRERNLRFAPGPRLPIDNNIPILYFTKRKFHYMSDNNTMSCSLAELEAVCRRIRLGRGEIELIFQRDRSMADVLEMMRRVYDGGFSIIYIGQYFGCADDDTFVIEEKRNVQFNEKIMQR